MESSDMRHVDEDRPVKPTKFIYEIVDVDESVDPPLSDGEMLRLSNEYQISEPRLARLGIYIYGLNSKNHHPTVRQDGVIAGIDTFTSTDSSLVDSVREFPNGEKIDLDAGRLAAFIAREEDTPFEWADHEVLFNKKPSGFYMTEFPKDNFRGRYYVRTSPSGMHNRLVINPRPSCESNCKWCARAYPDRIRLLNEKLDRRVTDPEDLILQIESDPEFIKLGGIEAMKEVNFVSGDFLPNEPVSQTRYLVEMIEKLRQKGFTGNWYYAGHQIFEGRDLEYIADKIGPGRVCYTLEHLTRRQELMPLKGKVPLEKVSEVLKHTAKIMGIDNTEYYLISGLDPANTVKKWIDDHKDFAKPQVHVFTPYAPSHFKLVDKKRIDQLKTALEIRSHVLKTYGHGINSGSNRSLFSLDEF